MASEQEKAVGELTYIVGRFVFPVLTLLALDGLFGAERAGASGVFPGIHDWSYVRFMITLPWMLGSMGGIMIWISGHRRTLSRDLAGTLLMIMGSIISSSYETLSKFTAGH